MKNIFVITSKHRALDARIYQKQVRSLSKKHNVSFIHSDSNNREIGIYFKRGRSFYKNVLRLIVEQRPDVVMVHDFDLIYRLSISRSKFLKTAIVADIHEDYPLQVRYKPYLKSFIAIPLSRVLALIFPRILSRFDGVLYATDFIHQKYLNKVSSKQMSLRNYPILEEFRLKDGEGDERPVDLVYVGGISMKRGAGHIVELTKAGFKVVCAGPFKDQKSEELFNSMKENPNLEYLGLLPYPEIMPLLKRSKIGLVPLLPTENYLTSTPVKMFEYLAAGAYTLASDFPYWIDIYGGISGLEFLNFDNEAAVRAKVTELLNKSDLNKFEALENQYDWSSEGERLVKFIENLKR